MVHFVCAVAALGFWLVRPLAEAVGVRLPGADQSPSAEGVMALNPNLAGKIIQGDAQPANLPVLPGLWPQFRGPNRDGISPETTPLARLREAALECARASAAFMVGQSCCSAMNSWAAQQRRPTGDAKNFVLHPNPANRGN